MYHIFDNWRLVRSDGCKFGLRSQVLDVLFCGELSEGHDPCNLAVLIQLKESYTRVAEQLLTARILSLSCHLVLKIIGRGGCMN